MASVISDLNAGPGDIRRQVNLFLQGSTGSGPVSIDALSSSALFLLRAVPVARHAVLEHYAMSFDDAINTFLSFQDGAGGNMKEPESVHMSALQDVTGVLLSFIKSNPEAWAPVVSSWALSLLGQISSKYAAKRGIQHATSLNEVLQMWMACPPAQMLIEITTECFAAMVGGAPDMCVDALLEASVRYSPHFDWVVAHIGSCFPRTIITRVLNCGLKDFCSSGVDGQDKDMGGGGGGRNKVPKMASVVGILGHLASKHSQDIRKALMSLFEASVRSDSVSNKVTTLPFLLQLASMSDMLLRILTTDLVAALKPPVLNQLHRQFTRWKHAAPAEYNSFLNLVVHLIAKSNSGAYDIINFIICTAAPQGVGQGEVAQEEVRDTCVEIMHILLFELQRGVLSRKMDSSPTDIPLLAGLASQTDRLTSMLLSSEGKRVPWLQKLLTFTALQAGESCAANVLTSILFQARTPQQLGVFYRLKQGVELGMPGIAQSALVRVFSRLESPSSAGPSAGHSGASPSSMTLTALKNLERVVIVESSKVKRKLLSSSTIIECLRTRHAAMCDFLLSPHPAVSLSALRLIDMVGFPDDLSVTLLTQLCGAVTLAFFASLHQRSQTTEHIKSARMTQLCMSCIEQLSRLPSTRSLLIHYLVEAVVQKEHIHLFGGRWSPSTFASASTPAVASVNDNVSLMEENRQQSLSIARPRFHSSVYHGGIIRQSVKAHSAGKVVPKELVSRNCLTFIETLWLCCRELNRPGQVLDSASGGSEPGEEAMETDQSATAKGTSGYVISESCARTLGCAVVEMLTLDSLYNDVNWQDPDFRRVTTERDTMVWKRVEELPVLLSVIQEFSSSCVFLYYASPVLRSLMAVVMNQLEVSREKLMSGCPKHHEVAVKLVYCLTKGFLIVPPLSNVAELFPFVSPYEGYLLLLTLWHYIKDNPPSEFESEVKRRTCDNSHTFVVHSILHSNIAHMGHLCPRIFNM
ncbi:integrator complex subunit 5 [Aplysia californica]|uniref:Integrator complex subunit 5 n=1 Tax=Aplysia californica TaxID=6500 RepID=A0ABM0JPU3_APLCA|nr:integrator complex subunit 5 [Aplysia californica]